MAWMVWQALLGLVTLGDIALLYQALSRGQRLAGSLQGNLGRVYSSTIFLGNLFEFLELEPEIVSPARPRPVPRRLTRGIAFRGVRFHYPGTDRLVFDGFDFHVPAGRIVAIVGANGAGKTTMMKLLCRFYDPQEGAVEIDGIDLRELPLGELRRMITALFQFPVPFLATVRENIAMGDLSGDHDLADIEAAARRAGAHDFISRLPEGYETLLGKWFPGGHQLSGGEWQRLALARSFLRDAEIMILDEPTSYLDSWAEIDWFQRFRELARGRTAILITHRFATARYADVIHVMDEGGVVESGTHEELVAKGGRYARSWLSQTRRSDDAQAPSGSTAPS
jgi:ATP-binding cassette subfamily B protein